MLSLELNQYMKYLKIACFSAYNEKAPFFSALITGNLPL